MEEETYWLVTVPVHDHEPYNTKSHGKFERKFCSLDDAEVFFDKAWEAWNKSDMGATRDYDFVEENSGISGFVNGKPKLFECRRVK